MCRLGFAVATLPTPIAGRFVRHRCQHTQMSVASRSPQPIILAPGQGAQKSGMGIAWSSLTEAGKAIVDEADEILNDKLPRKLSELMREGGAILDRTDIAQPALFVAGAISLAESGISTAPAAAGGLSLGEYTALYAAGALSFADGVRLVAARGALMQSAAMESAGGMVALIGVDESTARDIAAESAQGDVLVASNFNAPGQVVLSGGKNAVIRAAELAKSRGKRAAILDVAGAFHSPFMQSAADQLEKELARTTFSPLKCTVVSNVTGKPFVDGEIAPLLAKGLTSEVRWEACLRHLVEHNSGAEFVELAPGKTIAGMMRKVDRKIKVLSLEASVPVVVNE